MRACLRLLLACYSFWVSGTALLGITLGHRSGMVRYAIWYCLRGSDVEDVSISFRAVDVDGPGGDGDVHWGSCCVVVSGVMSPC